MKGLILSGGKGTRLRPITHTGAKQLIPVANKPILFYGLEAMAEAGIREVGIVVGHTRSEIERETGDGSRWDMTITYIDQPEPLGLAHAVLISRDYLGDEDFVMYLGDNILKSGIASLVEEFGRNRPEAMILLSRVPDPGRFGVAEIEGDRVTGLVEKPKVPPSDLALVGVYLFQPAIHQAVENIEPSRRGELEITDAIQYLIDGHRRVESHIVEGWWKDTGQVKDILEANRMVLENIPGDIQGKVDEESRVDHRVILEEGAEVKGSVIRGPAAISRGTKVINSFIGPFTSIARDSIVENSEVEHSIIMEESVIKDVRGRISESLIGRGVQVIRLRETPRVFRFLLGDKSEVGLL
jgi:glucose-1-phosphate thymidylyltransferase